MNSRMKMGQELKIGLEIHCQLTNLQTKLFCDCLSNYRNSLPNENTCPICLGLPGTLPLLNKRAVEFASMICMAFNCSIPEKISFYRKNYFYPDLPKNYQTTQYNSYELSSIGYEGSIEFVEDSKSKHQTSKENSERSKIRVTRVQLEEDPGKITYEEDKSAANNYSLIDYNRAGVSLVEIVTEPDFSSPIAVRTFLNEIVNLFEYLGVTDPSLEGSVRCDVNVSVGGGKKVEIKNISSFKEVEKSIYYEITRQKTLIMHDIAVKAETRHWDEKRKVTVAARSKEEEEEYRYFPEPDIPKIILGNRFVYRVRTSMPELPLGRLKRYVEVYKITEHTAKILVNDKRISDFFEESLRYYNSPIEIANWIVNELLTKINEKDRQGLTDHNVKGLDILSVSPSQVAEIAKLVEVKSLNRTIAREIFDKSVDSGTSPLKIIENLEIEKISDEASIIKIIQDILNSQPQLIEQSRSNPNVINYILGLIMKETRGRVNPQIALKLIKESLEEI
ncbi:Asp-tRNA(Asn)/Glu-tRNA(Gln) amidotransferase subunit GatB [soil metagenome]